MKNIFAGFSALAMLAFASVTASAQSIYHPEPPNTAILFQTSTGEPGAVWFDSTGLGDVLLLGHEGGGGWLADVLLDGPADLGTTIAHDGGMGNYINIMKPDIQANLYLYDPPNYVATSNATPYNKERGNVTLREYFSVSPVGGHLTIAQVPYTPGPNPHPLP